MAHSGRQNADDLLMTALAAGSTIRDAAKLAGVGERTAARRWAEPCFRARVSALRAQTMESALGSMTEGMTEAAATLRRLLSAESETVQLGAARSLLEMTVKLRENVDFERRLLALEGSAPDEQGEPEEEVDEA